MNEPTVEQRRCRLIAQCAMRGCDVLSAADKVELLLGLADRLPDKAEAEAARATAWAIKAADEMQLKFRELLGGEGPPAPPA